MGTQVSFVKSMKMAKRIQELRTGKIVHSWRRIAEIICEEYDEEAEHDLYGNQLYGSEMCKEAAFDWLKISEEEYQEKWL